MKLFTKLTLFITLSKMAVAGLFILILPLLVEDIAYKYNDFYLREQKKKVLQVIQKNGIDAYLQGEENYGSYTMLKEEYISLEPATSLSLHDTIATVRRLVEGDTLTYRVLSHQLQANKRTFLLEIGKKTATISQYNKPLQRVALYVLGALIIITIVIDLIFTRLLLHPLGKIISTRLLNRRFPFKTQAPPIKTSTTDFRYLDESLVELMTRINAAFEKEKEFTSNASHELMTPISILQSKMENMLVDTATDEEQQKKILGMMKTLNRLKKIVRALLLISRIENDQFPKNDTIVPSTLVAEVMEELEHRLDEKKLHFSSQLTPDIALPHLNHDLVFQLIYNLLNNAIKYNKTGGSIRVTDERLPGAYRLTIADTGVGIDPRDIPVIFDRFRKTPRDTEEGYGLGLSIVSTIARYYHIQVSVDAAIDQGSAFTLTFPL